jgi:inositol transport system substrate-binding protein
MGTSGKKAVPLIMVGDLGDPNAVGRKNGFYNVIDKYPDLFEKPIEVATGWDAATALANLEAAITANPNVDFLFTSSDFRSRRSARCWSRAGKWKKAARMATSLWAASTASATACQLIKDGFC